MFSLWFVLVFLIRIGLVKPQSGDDEITTMFDDDIHTPSADENSNSASKPNPYEWLPPAPVPGPKFRADKIQIYGSNTPSESLKISHEDKKALSILLEEIQNFLTLKYTVESQTHPGNLKYNMNIKLYNLLFQSQELLCPYNVCEFGNCELRDIDSVSPTNIPEIAGDMVIEWNTMLLQPMMFFGIRNENIAVLEDNTNEGDDIIHNTIMQGSLAKRIPQIDDGPAKFIFSPEQINFLQILTETLNSLIYSDLVNVNALEKIVRCVCWDGFFGDYCDYCLIGNTPPQLWDSGLNY
ncbi:uncharacterized protein LOC120338034 [Styela clava]